MTVIDEIYDKLSKKTQVSMSVHKSAGGTELNIYVANVNSVRAVMDDGTLVVELPKGPLSFKKDGNGGLKIDLGKDDELKLENWELHSVDMKGDEVMIQLKSKKND